jgi:hypothetical protein
LNSGLHAFEAREPHLQPFFVLVIFEIRVLLFAQASLGCDPPIYTSPIVGMTGVQLLHSAFSFETGSLKSFLPRLVWN